MSDMRTELDRALARELAVLDAAHVAAREAWEAAKSYEEAAWQVFSAASTRYLLVLNRVDRGQR